METVLKRDGRESPSIAADKAVCDEDKRWFLKERIDILHVDSVLKRIVPESGSV